MLPKFPRSDKKLQQLLLASGSAVIAATLSSGAVATGPTAPNCPAVFPEFDCYAHYIACSTIPEGTQVATGPLSKGRGPLVPFGGKEMFYLSSEGELNNAGADSVAEFPFWMSTGDQGMAQVDREDLDCSSALPSVPPPSYTPPPPPPPPPCTGYGCGS
jgi:hypothetical protein